MAISNEEYLSPKLPWTAWILLLTFVGLSYGEFWARGGYADDFAFLAYSHSHTYWEALLQWGDRFNSRYTQAVLMPALMKAFATQSPPDFHWIGFHLLGLGAFLLALALLGRILALFSAPVPLQLVALFLFALHPVKGEALLWPATIVGYILPATLFTLGAWAYLLSATRSRSSPALIAVAIAMFILGMFAIEQLVVLIPLLVLVRLLSLESNTRQRIAHIAMAVGLIGLFLLATAAGRTSEKLSAFTAPPLAELPSHMFGVLLKASDDLITLPYRYLLDPFYWPDLAESWSAPVVAVLGVAALLTAGILVKVGPCSGNRRGAVPALSTGLLLLLAPLVPFLLLTYYLPVRAMYLPSWGFALVAGGVYCVLADRWKLLRIPLASLFAAVLLSYGMVNLYLQRDFAEFWRFESRFLGQLSALSPTFPDGADVHLFNVPEELGPAPGLVDRFTFHGMLNWIDPARGLEGNTVSDLSDIFDLDALASGKSDLVRPAAGRVALFWLDGQLLPIDQFGISNASARLDKQGGSLLMRDFPLRLSASYRDGYHLELTRLWMGPPGTLAILALRVRSPNPSDRGLRLVLHGIDGSGQVVPLDVSVSDRTGFQWHDDAWERFVPIYRPQRFQRLRLSLSQNGEMFEMTTADTAQQLAGPLRCELF